MQYKILLVDDEAYLRKGLRKFLEGKGYNVLEARDGDEALEVYRRERPDVVLLDVLMPGKDGIETLRELRAFDPEAKVIMVTAVPEEQLDGQATEVAEGTVDYMTKPFDPDSLERVISILTRMGLLGDDQLAPRGL